MKEYKTFSEFYEEMKTLVLFRRVDRHLMVWFYRQRDGSVEICATFHAAFGGFYQKLFTKNDCHPQFAWGIYQMLSNPAFLES